MNDRAEPAAGIFLTHDLSPRVKRHFERLVDETGPLVAWHLVYNEGNRPYPSTSIPYADPATVMPRRFGHSNAAGMIEGGYLDVMIVPLVMAATAPHVWVMEYDVDFSGSWADLFCQFRDVDADVLATTLRYRTEFPEWGWWPHCQAPPAVADSDYLRGFIPMMRLSRAFAHRYAEMMSDEGWVGHSEFTIPTAAVTSGAKIEDLGEAIGSFTPPGRAINYSGRDGSRSFVWRPSRSLYFHEAPRSFAEPNWLYHPVKPGIEEWATWSG